MDDMIVARMKKRTTRLTWLAALSGLLALATGSCESATNGGMGTVHLYVAGSSAAGATMSVTLDGPPTATIADPAVTVMSVVLIPGEQEVANFGPGGQSFPLLATGNGVGELLATATIPAGTYGQLRLTMPSVTATVDGVADVVLPVPSGMQTGIKIVFGEPLEVEDGVAVNVVLVFDLDHSFVIQGPPGEESVSFQPVIHVSVEP